MECDRMNISSRNIDSVRRNLGFDDRKERKRKSSASSGSYTSCVSDMDSMYSCSSSLDDSFRFDEAVASSPKEEDLSDSLKQCRIEAKRPRKSFSAPTTPSRHENLSLSRCRSYELTPKKPLGTPERNRLLYPSISEKPLPYKLKTPRKHLPAKKRLFVCRDFVRMFSSDNNYRHIVEKIWGFLEDSDLVNVARVSRLWRSAVREDRVAARRWREYKQRMICSKENLEAEKMKLRLVVGKENKPSPAAKTPGQRCLKLARKLGPNQKILKCIRCSEPSVLDPNGIAQCSRASCLYIWCSKCQSGSSQGPENFYCQCEKGSTPPPTSLGDISNISNISPQHYYNPEQTDSGYLTNPESSFGSERRRSVFSDSNLNWNSPKSVPRKTPPSPDAAAYSAIAELCRQKRRIKVIDPSSPPHVRNHIIGSKKSKRSLQRLKF